jgi:lysophospholipase L1-like esterase
MATLTSTLTTRRAVAVTMPMPAIAIGGNANIYQDKILDILSTAVVSLYPFSDTVGFVATDVENAYNAAYRNDGASLLGLVLGQAGVGDGKTSVLFNGAGAITIPAALQAAFTGQEFSIFVWLKVANAAVWTDGTEDRVLLFTADASNFLTLRKPTAGSAIDVIYRANATNKTASIATTSTDWIRFCLTVSKSDDKMIVYLNGAQSGATVTTIPTWTGALVSGFIGSQEAVGTTPWNGNMAYCLITNRALTAHEVLAIDSVTNPILFYGDSKTYGTGDDTPPAVGSNGYPPLLLSLIGSSLWTESPARIARPGWTVAMMKAAIDADLATFTTPCREVLINLGANDIGPLEAALTPATWQSDLGYILDAMHTKMPSAHIRVARIWRRYNNGQMTDLNDTWIPAVLATRSWATVGIDERLLLPSTDNGATYTADGIHPNRAGYTLEAAAWKVVIGA